MKHETVAHFVLALRYGSLTQPERVGTGAAVRRVGEADAVDLGWRNNSACGQDARDDGGAEGSTTSLVHIVAIRICQTCNHRQKHRHQLMNE